MQDFFKEQTSKLLTYVAPGGHTRVAEVRGLGGGVALDVAYGDLLAGVHVLQVPTARATVSTYNTMNR